jgi:hypothetical protein
MVQASTASHFWSAVEDCLVNFHQFDRDKAAEKVIATWRRLPAGPETKCFESSFEDMIYHAEPWYIACNIAGQELSLGHYQLQYADVLQRNHLA